MALLTLRRPVREPVPERADDLLRVSVLFDKVTGTQSLVCEWEIELPDGRRSTRSERVSDAARAQIVDDAFSRKMLLAAQDTHPRVTADQGGA